MTHAAEIESPELVLVSPPEWAERARAALPDYAYEYEVARVRRAFAAASGEDEPIAHDRRFSRGSITFTMLVALNCLAPFVLLIAARR